MKKQFLLASAIAFLGLTSCANQKESQKVETTNVEEIQKIENENVELEKLDTEINNDIEDIDSILSEIE